MAKRETHKEDKSNWPLFNRLLYSYIELTRFDELPENPKIGKNYEYWPEGCLCANGNPYHGCIRLGSKNKLIIGFSGGGVSVNEYTAARPQRIGGKGEMFYSDDVRFADIVPKVGTFGKGKKNPFKEWNLLFVPYATGDFHCGMGDFNYKDVDGKKAVLYHHGYKNYRALLKKIKELVPEPEQILVTGFSAGAFATALLASDIAEYFPDCHNITACVDSAIMHYDWHKVSRDVWKTPDKISERLTGTEIVSDSLIALHKSHPEIKIMFCCSKRDAALTQMDMFFEDGRWIPDKAAGLSFERKLSTMIKNLIEAIPDISIFIFDTPDKHNKAAELTVHCLCGSNGAFSTYVDGVSCAEWMRRGVDGEVMKLGLNKLNGDLNL